MFINLQLNRIRTSILIRNPHIPASCKCIGKLQVTSLQRHSMLCPHHALGSPKNYNTMILLIVDVIMCNLIRPSLHSALFLCLCVVSSFIHLFIGDGEPPTQ